MKNRANAFQSEHGGGFTIEIYCGTGLFRIRRVNGGGRGSKHVSRHPKYGVDRSRIPSGEFSRREARMPRFFNNPHPSLFLKFFMELGDSKSWMVVVRIVESLDRPRSVDFLTATLVSFLFPLSLSLERESKLRTFSIFLILCTSSFPPFPENSYESRE